MNLQQFQAVLINIFESFCAVLNTSYERLVGWLAEDLSPIFTQGTWQYKWNSLHGGLSKS